MGFYSVELIDKRNNETLFVHYFLTKRLAEKFIRLNEKRWAEMDVTWALGGETLNLWISNKREEE